MDFMKKIKDAILSLRGALSRSNLKERDCFADPRRLARVPRAMTGKGEIASSVRPELVEGRTARNDKGAGIKHGCGDEKGFVLVLAIVVMAAMTAIGLAVVTTATTDILIARNEQESKRAFYFAQAGIEEAMGRMGLPESNIARFLGETTAQRTARIGGNPPANLQPDFTTFPGLDLPGSYRVSTAYAYEAPISPNEPWTNGGASGEIILYCADFGFTSPPAPVCSGNKATPIYQITSTGTTSQTGIDAVIVANIAATVFNVVPPFGEVYSNSAINMNGSAALSNTEICGQGATAGCVAPDCIIDPACPADPDVDMTTWLGIDMDDMSSYADAPSPYTQSGAGTVTYSPSGSEWGEICSTCTDCDLDTTHFEEPPADTNDVYGLPGGDNHVCDNESKLIFIDNDGAGDARIPGGSGRGILVVSGNLNVSGTLNWEGMIYVMGELRGNGTVNVFGTMMVNNSVAFAGNITAFGNEDIALSVADSIGGSKLVRWYRR